MREGVRIAEVADAAETAGLEVFVILHYNFILLHPFARDTIDLDYWKERNTRTWKTFSITESKFHQKEKTVIYAKTLDHMLALPTTESNKHLA